MCHYVVMKSHGADLSARVRFSSSESCRETNSATSRGGCDTNGVGPSSVSARSMDSRRREHGSESPTVRRERTSGVRRDRVGRREMNAWTHDF